jgi:uncharacterized membrane protein YeaQ/YmgE (transglycosylase-associated protein family)
MVERRRCHGGAQGRFRAMQWRKAQPEREVVMSLLAWIVLGLISGFIASKIVNKTGEGFFLDIALGVIGAVVGGWLLNYFGKSGVTGLNAYSFFVAILGAVLLLVAFHAVRRATHSNRSWSQR